MKHIWQRLRNEVLHLQHRCVMLLLLLLLKSHVLSLLLHHVLVVHVDISLLVMMLHLYWLLHCVMLMTLEMSTLFRYMVCIVALFSGCNIADFHPMWTRTAFRTGSRRCLLRTERLRWFVAQVLDISRRKIDHVRVAVRTALTF